MDKATRPANHADNLAPPLIAMFNSSLRERTLPKVWKMANIIPLPKNTCSLRNVNRYKGA